MNTFSTRRRKAMICAAVILAGAMAGMQTTEACTTLIVGREASADGSRIMGRTSDSHGLEVMRVETHYRSVWLSRGECCGFC